MSFAETFAKYVKQPDPSQVIWRYLDFPKFMSMLDSSSIFFCQGNLFDDPLEGVLPSEYVPKGSHLENYLKTSNFYTHPMAYRATTLISCWSMNDTEASLMWGKYAPNCGIAIKTTIKKLIENLELSGLSEVYKGAYTYGYVALQPGESAIDIFQFFTGKNKVYEQEQEYRIAVRHSNLSQINGGLPVHVNLTGLIDGITVSPKSPKWFLNLVQSIVTKSGLTIQVSSSDLDRTPFD